MRISGREKTFLIGGACFLVVILIFQLIFLPALKRGGDVERLILQKEKDLTAFRLMRKELDSLRSMRANLVQKIPVSERSLPPLSKLDRIIEKSSLKQNIRSIKPSPAAGESSEGLVVEVMMEKVELPQLVRFFYEVQSSPGGFYIARIAMKPRYTTPRYLDLILQMIFYQG